MGRYSRRQFLQLTNAAFLSNQLSFSIFSEPQVFPGRTFEATPIYHAQDPHSEVLRHLWPDSIVNVYYAHENWYQLAEGYVQRTAIQPMTPYSPSNYQPITSLPFWAEVATPVAVVRQWCAPDAPLVTRIGHGGVVQIVDRLSGNRERADWYGIATQDDELLGWTQAIFWRPVCAETSPTLRSTLHIDQNTQLLTGYEGGEIVFQTPISSGETMMPGNHEVTGRQPTGTLVDVPQYAQSFHGVPWRVHFGEDYELSGTYWHNRFGSPVPGPAVQMSTQMAHWLYVWLGDYATISVV